MEFEGQFTVAVAKATVWTFFNDARQLIDCLSDPHTVEVIDAQHFRGTITTGVAFIRGTFRFEGSYTERTPPDHLSAAISGTGMGSGLTLTVLVDLTEAGGSTTAHWKAEMNVTGSIATVGERMIRGTVDKKVQELFSNAEKKLAGSG